MQTGALALFNKIPRVSSRPVNTPHRNNTPERFSPLIQRNEKKLQSRLAQAPAKTVIPAVDVSHGRTSETLPVGDEGEDPETDEPHERSPRKPEQGYSAGVEILANMNIEERLKSKPKNPIFDDKLLILQDFHPFYQSLPISSHFSRQLK